MFPRPLCLLWLALAQRLVKGQCKRIPEPEIMEALDQVEGYDAAGESTLAVVYALAVELLNLSGFGRGNCSMLDLGCGTAKFTRRVAETFGLRRIVAIDGSKQMLGLAAANLSGLRDVDVELLLQDITRTDDIPSESFDLVACSLTAHHLPGLETVEALLCEMGRIAKPNGVVFLIDLSRLRTRTLMEQYVEVFSVGQSTVHNMDFLNSMLAAFTPAELRSVIPKDGDHSCWIHFAMPVLPTLQVVLRLPRTAQPCYRPIWRSSPVSYLKSLEWRILRSLLLRKCVRSWAEALAMPKQRVAGARQLPLPDREHELVRS